jgi:hypothetical protein
MYAVAENQHPIAKLSIKVLDDGGHPLSSMPVHVWLSKAVIVDGLTNTNGLCVVEGMCTTKDIPITVMKDGFYETKVLYQFSNYLSIKDNKWQPWNPEITVFVRRVIKPIPMYAKKVSAIMPVLDEFVGYDLVKGDWVTPYGSGIVSDFQFKMKKHFVDIRNFNSSLELIVTNISDGIRETAWSSFLGSTYRLPRKAPTGGYQTSFSISESSTNYFRPNDDQCFLFRVRSVTNVEGNITSALYGKITNPISFDVRRHVTGIVKFTYYLNPEPNDRNLEFDPKRNLFKNLSSLQDVRDP